MAYEMDTWCARNGVSACSIFGEEEGRLALDVSIGPPVDGGLNDGLRWDGWDGEDDGEASEVQGKRAIRYVADRQRSPFGLSI